MDKNAESDTAKKGELLVLVRRVEF